MYTILVRVLGFVIESTSNMYNSIWEQKNKYQNSYVFYFLYFSAVAYLVDTFWLPTTLRKSEGGNKLPCMNAQCGALHPKNCERSLENILQKKQ